MTIRIIAEAFIVFFWRETGMMAMLAARIGRDAASAQLAEPPETTHDDRIARRGAADRARP